MFNNAQKFTLHNGHFNNITYNVSQDIMLKLNPVGNASFKSDRHASCLKGTRTGILEKLMQWARNPDSQPIFWLSGIAGTGKSTIAQSFCEMLSEHNLLGASFFCSQESEDLRQVERIVPTLVYFWAQHSKEYHDQISIALEGDATLASQGIRRQLNSLLMYPLQNMKIPKNNWHYVLVIDALDECENKDATQIILSILRDMPAQFYLHVHIFISCRPEYYIQQELEKTFNKDLLRLHDMKSEIVQKDIELYLKSALHDICVNDIARLAEQAGRLFIYAFTQVQYLKKAHGPVALKSRLNGLLENKGICKSIDGLYNVLLAKAVEGMEVHEKEDAIHLINIIVSLSDPLSQHALSQLWKPFDVTSFRSVLDIPESEDDPIHVFHASFPNYILNQDHCHSEFHCDPQATHHIIALACMQYMNRNLKFNACNMETNDHISSFSETQISPALQYSCKHWISHLIKCERPGNEIMIEFEEFVTKCFFCWMEHISILQLIDNAIPALKTVLTWLQKYDNNASNFLQPFVYEGQRFLQSVAGLLKDYPLQLYYSGMAWLPKASVLHKIQCISQDVPRVVHGLRNTWDMCEVIIQCLSEVCCIGFSPDGKQVVSALADLTIRIWSAVTGKEVQKLEGHSHEVTSVAFSADVKHVVSGSYDTTICIWNVATGKQIHNLKGHSAWVSSVAFSPDSKHVMSGSGDKTVRIWDMATGRQTQRLECHSDKVNCVAFSPEGDHVIVGSGDKTICIWDMAIDKEIQRQVEFHSTQKVNSVAFSPDGKQVVSAQGNTICIWDVVTGKQIQELEGHSDWVRSVAFSPDGAQVVSGSQDCTICIWDVATGKQIHKLGGHFDSVDCVAFSPDGKQVVSGSQDRTLCIWNVSIGIQMQKPAGHSEYVSSVALSPDGRQVVSGSHDKTAHIWCVATGRQIQKLEGHSGYVKSVAFSPDGTQVVSGSQDCTICIWNVATGKQIQKLEGQSDWVESVAFSPDGKQVVSGSWYKTVCIWNVATGMQMQKLEAHHGVEFVAFSPDGEYAMSKSDDTKVCIWNVATGKRFPKLEGHSEKVNSVAFSSDGKQMVTGSLGHLVLIWNLATGQQIYRLKGHSAVVCSVSFSPDGKQVVSGSYDKTICVWNVATGKQMHRFECHSWIECVVFSSDGNQVLFCPRDGTIQSLTIAIENKSQNIGTACQISIPPSFQDGFLHFFEPKYSCCKKFWILPQYQDISNFGTTVTQHGSTLSFGCPSGAIVIIQMDGQSRLALD